MKSQIPPPKRIPFTKDGYQKILEEKARLLADRPEAVEHLHKAREMGDLSENGYYKSSRAKLSSIDANLKRIERLIRLGKIIESTGNDFINFGNTATISDGSKTYEYTLVGGYESDPAQNTVSQYSPIGKALINKKAGEEITVLAPNGTKRYRILSIR